MPQYKDPISLILEDVLNSLIFAGSISLCENIKYSFEEIQDKSVKGESKVRLHVYRKMLTASLWMSLIQAKEGRDTGMISMHSRP